MKKLFAVGIIGLMLSACSVNAHDVLVRTAINGSNDTAVLVETAETTAALLYKTEQEMAVKQVEAAHGTKLDATQAVTKVRESWQTTWVVFQQIRATYGSLVQAIQAYNQDTSGSDAQVLALTTALTNLYSQVVQDLSAARTRVGM